VGKINEINKQGSDLELDCHKVGNNLRKFLFLEVTVGITKKYSF
jgi:hypothetical protein